MKKISCILLALLLLGVQQGVASEKQRREKTPKQTAEQPTKKTKLQRQAEKGDGIAKGLLEALNPAPVNIVAVHEFLQNEGYAPEWRESGKVKCLTFKYQDRGIFIFVDEDFVLLRTGLKNLTPFILTHTKQQSLLNRDCAYIYQTCIESSRNFRVVKFDYDTEVDIVFIDIEAFIPSMNIFKRYFNLYTAALKQASDEFEQSLNEKLGIK